MKKLFSIIILGMFFLVLPNQFCNSQIPTEGLLAYYPLDGNGNDMSGNGYNATTSGALYCSDRMNNSNSAFNFMFGNALITSSVPASEFDGKATVSMWIYPNLNTTYSGLFQFNGNTGFFRARILRDGKVWVYVPWCCVIETEANAIERNTWQHIAISVDEDDAVKVFINGELILEEEISCDIICYNWLAGFQIGRSWPTAEIFRGAMDDIRIYNRAITENEAELLAREGLLPVAACQDIEIELDENGEASIIPGNINNGSSVYSGSDMTLSASQTYFDCDDIGENTVELTVSDDEGYTDVCDATVTVTDNTAPTASVSVDMNSLWPPNHKMKTINVSISASDNCSVDDIVLVGISSSQADAGQGNGDRPNDIQDADIGSFDTQFKLRAERFGYETDRIYTAVYRVTDISGNSSTFSVDVTVPHDNGNNKISMNTMMADESGVVLDQNIPNPFGEYSTIKYYLPESGAAVLTVYDLSGNRIEQYSLSDQTAGWHEFNYSSAGLPSGVYYYTLDFKFSRKSRLMHIIR